MIVHRCHVQWSIAKSIWNVEVTFLPDYKNSDNVQVAVLTCNVKEESATIIQCVYFIVLVTVSCEVSSFNFPLIQDLRS